MKTIIARKFEFEACHHLPENKIYGKCSNLHGHRYELVVYVSGEVTTYGWIANFSEIKEIVNSEVINKYDHADLNAYFEISTAENIAIRIFTQLEKAFAKRGLHLEKVKLYETKNSFVEVER